MIDLKSHLNSSQLEAATSATGALLVIAGAGSGKTRVIEYRVLNLVQNNIEPSSILLLTFTREAARRMLSRATRHHPRCKYVDGGTFHSFAYKILKKYAKDIGFDESFSILDEPDAHEAIRRCCVELGLSDKTKRFPRSSTLKDIISISINKGASIEHILEREYPQFITYTKEIESLRKKYAAYKLQKNYLDYDDLLTFLKILLENDKLRDKITRKYRFIMVDEYQDTNSLQGDITYLLGKEHGNVMVVGDDAQSIYGFRGASHANIMEFPKKFSHCKIIKLEENYRSTQQILDLANAVMEDMENKYSKCLVASRGDSGDRPGLIFFKDAYGEAEWICDKVMEFREDGTDLSEQAVLFRSSYISILLQAELSKRNIPYQVFGGLKFYETAHVKDLLSYLKVIANPKDELSWSRLLLLIEGIGPKTAERILAEIAPYPDISGISDKVFKQYDTKYKYSAELAKLGAAIKKANEDKYNVEERLGIALDYYIPLLKDKFDDWPLRLNDLETLKDIASGYNSLPELLADFAIESPERGVFKVEAAKRDDERPLTLSTIHSAKGLEWKNVFILGLSDGVLPSSLALGDEEEIEEERRIFYVAVTRAKDNLFLSMHHEGSRGGITQFNKISRFLDSRGILETLDRGVAADKDEQRFLDEEPQEFETIYNKDQLLKRIIDYFDADI
ncbi:MAG: ATP-dependent helicase [Candidatus Omnitrophica bacterium]|nr:ATP-dependent helicase [Candidatus Omnitrophota bacterium]